jgi:hypothetical protein
VSDSVFNPDLFLATSTDETGDTRYTPVPTGEWRAQVRKVDARRAHSEKTGLDYTFLDVQWVILDESVRETLNIDEPRVRQSLILDLTPAGGLDFGRSKNVRLNRLREAVGQNTQGKPWRPSDLEGQMATIRVTHRPHQETGEPMAEVSAVTVL